MVELAAMFGLSDKSGPRIVWYVCMGTHKSPIAVDEKHN